MKKLIGVILFILFLMIIGGRQGRAVAVVPAYLKSLGYLPGPQGNHEHPWDIAQEISHQLFDIRQRYPEISVILMPESSCKFALNNYPKIIHSWIDTALHNDCVLFIGSHRQDENRLFNCLYCIEKGPIILTYDKQQPIPFGEYIPYPWSKIESVHHLFLNNKKVFNAGCSRSPFSLPQFSCIPQICYELYFSSADPGKEFSKVIPILAVVNDAWYKKTPYFQKLLFLLVRYQAMEWSRPIIYVAHTGGWWLGTRGEKTSLKQ